MTSNEQESATATNPYAPPTTLSSPAAPTPSSLRDASTSLRFWTLMLDYVGMQLFGMVFGIGLVLSGNQAWLEELPDLVLGIGLMLAYYVTLEATVGRTLGKLILGTRVVNLEGREPSFRQIVVRTLSRLVPFEAFSYLSDRGGWHDRWSKTRVIRTRG